MYITACGYLAKKIYCFGGSADSDILPPEIYMSLLDVSNLNGSTPKDLATQWENIETDAKTITLQSRRYAQTVPLPDGKSMLINGGSGPGDMLLANQTLVFNGETRSWSCYENYVEYPYGNRQM